MAKVRVSAARRKRATRSSNPGTRAGALKAWKTRRAKAAARKRAAKKAAATRARNRKKSASTRTRRKSSKKRGPQKRRTTRRVALRSKSTRRPVSITVRANPKRRRKRRKNPEKGMFLLPVMGGVDMGAVAVGTLAAVVLKNLFKNVGFIKDQLIKLPDGVQPFVGPGLIVAAGWAANKYVKNRHVKILGAYAAAAAIVLAVDDYADAKIAKQFSEWDMGGAYYPMGGAHIQLGRLRGLQGPSNMGGTHIQLKGNTGGMFGGISNLG